MPSDLYRPPSPNLSEWNDSLETVLLGAVRPSRVRPRRRIGATVWRWARSSARPVGHGLATMGAAVIAVSTALPPLAVVEPTPGTEPGIVNLETRSALVPETAIESFTPIEPRSDLHQLLAMDDSNRLPADIETSRRGLTGEPQSTARAVPTPDGGGSTTVTLRPTVR